MMTARVDYHSHILPGLDDGAVSLEESLAMAEAAWRLGFTEIIATPHYEDGFLEPDRGAILEQTLRVNGSPKKRHPFENLSRL